VILAYEEGALARTMLGAQSTKSLGLRKIERDVVAVLQHSSKEALRQWIAAADAA